MVKIIKRAEEWLKLKSGENFLNDKEYCASRDIFQARLDKSRSVFESQANSNPDVLYPLIAIIGEIGNNSFDHNLGNWRDITGIFFAIDYPNCIIVLADRGQGIYSSIKKVVPKIKDDLQAIEIAFTKKISGRHPEKRGNGLKFVANVAQKLGIDVFLQSGKASACIDHQNGLKFQKEKGDFQGVLAIIKFNYDH